MTVKTRKAIENTIQMRLAQSEADYRAAHQLLQSARGQSGLAHDSGAKYWLLKQHALPSTGTLIATAKGEVLGAICLFGESPFGLPIEAHHPLAGLRSQLTGRTAEISFPAVKTGHEDLLLPLYQLALKFGSTFCLYEHFVTEVPTSAWKQLENSGFLSELSRSKHILALCSPILAESPLPCKVEFPEYKFFRTAHQHMPPDVYAQLFPKEFFEKLSDSELRVLKNIYDFSDYARSLPNRGLQVGTCPKSRRFPLSCEGYLVLAAGEKLHVLVLDVSRQGLKIRSEEPLEAGHSYPLNLSVGLMKQTELIASVIWVDELSQTAGLQVQSGDGNWQELLDYLETSGSKTVA